MFFEHYLVCTVTRLTRGQMLDAEAEDNSSRPSPRPRTKFWPRGQLVLEDLPSLANTVLTHAHHSNVLNTREHAQSHTYRCLVYASTLYTVTARSMDGGRCERRRPI